MIKIPLDPAEMLLRNLKARDRLGLRAIPRQEQEKLRSWLEAAPLVISLDAPLNEKGRQLMQNMLGVLGLNLEQVAWQGSGKVRVDFCCQPPDNGRLWCWHPEVLLQKPQLKKQAYQALKKIKTHLSH